MRSQMTDIDSGDIWEKTRSGGYRLRAPTPPVRLSVWVHETQKVKRCGRFSRSLVSVSVRLLDSDKRTVLREACCGSGWWLPEPTLRSALGKARARADEIAAQWRAEWLGEVAP